MESEAGAYHVLNRDNDRADIFRSAKAKAPDRLAAAAVSAAAVALLFPLRRDGGTGRFDELGLGSLLPLEALAGLLVFGRWQIFGAHAFSAVDHAGEGNQNRAAARRGKATHIQLLSQPAAGRGRAHLTPYFLPEIREEPGKKAACGCIGGEYGHGMSTVQEIERAIEALSEEQLAEIRAWFWDRDIDRDALAGRLDALADEALREHRNGKTRML